MGLWAKKTQAVGLLVPHRVQLVFSTESAYGTHPLQGHWCQHAQHNTGLSKSHTQRVGSDVSTAQKRHVHGRGVRGTQIQLKLARQNCLSSETIGEIGEIVLLVFVASD